MNRLQSRLKGIAIAVNEPGNPAGGRRLDSVEQGSYAGFLEFLVSGCVLDGP